MHVLKKFLYTLGAEVLGSSIYRRLDFSQNKKDDSTYRQQRELFGNIPVKTIFDVGARYGEVSRVYRQLFPASKVFAFEPCPESYEIMLKNTHNDPSIVALKLGVSDQEEETKLIITKFNPTSSVFTPAKTNTILDALIKPRREALISTVTINGFTQKEGIEQIDILKLDIQGSELKALKGAENLLENRKILMIFAEVLFMKMYERQPFFHDLSGYLYRYGYELFNLYNPWYAETRLSWADALFICPAIAEKLKSA